MDVQSIITQTNREDEFSTATSQRNCSTDTTNNSILPKQNNNQSPASIITQMVQQQLNQIHSPSNNATTTNTTQQTLNDKNGNLPTVLNGNSTVNSSNATANTTTTTTSNTTTNSNTCGDGAASIKNNLNSGQFKSTVKQRHRGFLSQLLCCFRPPPPCAYHQDSIHSEQNSIFHAQRFQGKYLLPPVKRNDKICMVIDLDETLVHSSFKPINNADFVVPVEIDGAIHQVYVLKRPHVDEFLQRMGQLYECVLFTASLAKYADPVADLLDKKNIFKARLFRESCAFYRGNYVKDLSRLGRDLNRVIIVDNSPASYIFHPDNAVPVASWFDDMSDTELQDLIPFLESLSKADSIYSVLEGVKQNKLLSQINSTLGRPTQQPQALPYVPTTH